MDSMHAATIVRIASGFLCLLYIVVGVFYSLTLFNALKRCSVPSRTMRPGLVWLILIPLFNIIWHFFVVLGLARSMGNEFRTRAVPNAERRPGRSVGIAMCVCAALAALPFFLYSVWSAMPQVQSADESQSMLMTLGVLVVLVPLFLLLALAYFVLWIVYWSKIAGFSRLLDRTPVMSGPPKHAPRA